MQNRYVVYPKANLTYDPIPKVLVLHKWERSDLATLLGENFKGVSEFVVEQLKDNELNDGFHENLRHEEIVSGYDAGLLMILHGNLYFTLNAGCCESLLSKIEKSGIEIFFDLPVDKNNSTHFAKEVHSSATISRLDPNVLGIIFANLSPIDLANVSLANRQLNFITSKKSIIAQHVWERKFILHFPQLYQAEKSKPQTVWIEAFKRTYLDEYRACPAGVRLLFSIVKEGDVEMLKRFHQGKFVNSRPLIVHDLLMVDKSRLTIVDHASKRSYQSVLDFIYHSIVIPHYDNDGELKTVDDYRNTLIHWAVACNQKPDHIVGIIKGAVFFDVNTINRVGHTALSLAAINGNLIMVKALLDMGAKVDIPDTLFSQSVNPLYVAAMNGHLSVVEALLAKGSNIDAKVFHSHHETALSAAVRGGHLSVVEALLAKGASVDARHPAETNALYVAAQRGDQSVVELLLAKGANVDSASFFHGTALCAAAQGGHLSVVEALLSKGANVHAVRHNGATALSIAAENGHLAIVKALLAKGANVDAAQYDGATALFAAAGRGHLAAVEALLVIGVNVNAELPNGANALYAAAQMGHFSLVEALLAKGANADAALNNGSTALTAATRNGHIEIVKLLQIKLLEKYIEARENDPREYKTEIKLFGKKKGLGYTKNEKVSAATNMIKFLKGEIDSISDKDKKILGQGQTKEIVKPKKKM